MTLAQFAIAVGADPKWVQNAAAVLDRTFSYTVDEARHLGLVRRLHDALGMPLATASELAARALAGEAGAADCRVAADGDGVVAVVVDLSRYLSGFTARLARAQAHYEPRRRGRRPSRIGSSALERARAYGIDIEHLRASLERSPAERVRRLDENAEFVRTLRERRVG